MPCFRAHNHRLNITKIIPPTSSTTRDLPGTPRVAHSLSSPSTPHVRIHPHKYSSRQATASLEIPSATRRLQSNLKHAMEEEIADQTFWLPSLELSHILSPKKPKSGVVEEFLQLDDCDCIVDKQPFKEALKDVVTELKTFTPSAGSGESASYRSLAEFLTGCVKACHVALDKRTEFPLRQDRWYKDLEFIVGKAVVDSVDGAASLKPDITGGNGILAFAEERLYWKPPADKSTHRVTLPVEVKKQWKDMVSQAATYARCCSAQVQPGYSFLFWRSTKRATCADS